MKQKIGIVLPFQNGDLITATAVLHYRKELWGDADIVWFCNEPHSEALKYQDVELRYFPHGWDVIENDVTGKYSERVKKDKEDGKPEWEDWTVLRNSYNRLNQELKNNFNSFKDLTEAYFAAPWMLTPIQRHGLSYPECSKKVFGVPDGYEWHPVLNFSEEERDAANKFMEALPKRKTLCYETFAGSGQSVLNDEIVRMTIKTCEDILGDCNIVFVSHKYVNENEEFPKDLIDKENVYFAKDFSVRQCALIIGQSNLLLSVSSGVTVAASCWENKGKPFKIFQFCGSEVCSTKFIAPVPFESVYHDGKMWHSLLSEYKDKLISTLNSIK